MKQRNIEKIISYLFGGIGLFSGGFIIGQTGKSGILAGLFFVLCSIVIIGLQGDIIR
jgi:hypothetical protein